ncbi:Asp-tRNA(Asn)/Glu-tRNA(Gln) amidotransferase subunit GatA [Runella zeae]|uniref:Asp-tRNA(Asn)/Glu-tRNA(Gln) amidotransferase subunit GatA n=1 Tax=Runella zeae TaxID=94255 RepID=UPI00048FCC02|nr:Asp-tRNA(Asn)/Glu-tRNA(Gln) amidotransferase subunit GatA [Runella zeae]
MKSYTSFGQVQADLSTGRVSCRELVAYYLKNIEQKNPTLNAFVAVYDEEARQKAEEIDKKIAAGTAGRLAGMVVGIKDVLCYQGHGLQAGSQILDGFISQFTATAVQRILDEDAIIIGRQNCDEFAMGSSNENSAFGVVRNAADISRVPGGSSGGSAVAVQADMCLASLGSDTGGSVRQPAAFCGLVGFKPTYGRISRWGLIAYGSSFDCIGPIANSVEDVALLLEIMAGKDDFDSTVSEREVEKYTALKLDSHPLRIGYLRESLSEAIQPEIREATQAKLTWLQEQGYVVEPVDFELLSYILPTYYILTTAESSSNLSRFDGVRYGHRSSKVEDLTSLYKKSRSEGFGAEVKRRIMLGTFVLSASYYDAYYTKAQKVRRLMKEQTDLLFEKYDFLVMPTTPTTAFPIGDKTEDPLQMYLADIFTVQANVVGNPAVSIPNGTDETGLPIGLQIMGKPFGEAQLLAFCHRLVGSNQQVQNLPTY